MHEIQQEEGMYGRYIWMGVVAEPSNTANDALVCCGGMFLSRRFVIRVGCGDGIDGNTRTVWGCIWSLNTMLDVNIFNEAAGETRLVHTESTSPFDNCQEK